MMDSTFAYIDSKKGQKEKTMKDPKDVLARIVNLYRIGVDKDLNGESIHTILYQMGYIAASALGIKLTGKPVEGFDGPVTFDRLPKEEE